jgi:hypothetical protein
MLPVCGGVAMASAGMYDSIVFLKQTQEKKCYSGVFLFFRKKKYSERRGHGVSR